MKVALFFILLVSLSKAQAQHPQATNQAKKQTPSMTGIGAFKIGQTTPADVARVCAEAEISLQESYSLSATRDAGDSLVAFRVPYESPDEYADASDLASPDPQVSVIYFPEYTVSSVKIEELVLKFYKGLLYEIRTTTPGELPDAFKLKYGKPELRTLATPTSCVYKLTGRKVAYKDESFFERWYNGDIVALYYLGGYRDKNCVRQVSTGFSIKNEVKAKAVEAAEALALKARQVKQDGAKRKRLSEL
jgi:hypothetical protein